MDRRYYFGLFFLFLQALAILRNLFYDYNYFFWFCDFAPGLFAIAFFIGNKDIIKGIINFGLIPQIIFLSDFIYATTKGASLLGIRVDLIQFTSFSVLSTIFVHLTTIFALILTLRTKPNKKTIFYSLIFMFAVYLVALIFTPSSGDINYVYSTGNLLNSFNFTVPNIVWFWPLFVSLFIILPTQGLQYVLYRVFEKKVLNKSKDRKK
jgi:hypothetical protein